MLPQPFSEAVTIAAVEDVDRPMAGHVDQHSAVMTPPAEREIVDAEHGDRRLRRIRQCLDQPQQRVTACGRSDDRRQPGTGPPGQCEPDLRQHDLQASCQPRMRRGQPFDLFGEGFCRAGSVIAPKSPDLHSEQQHHPAHGDVSQLPLIAPMNSARRPPALSAPRGRRPDPS
jgi:hypothetical protein